MIIAKNQTELDLTITNAKWFQKLFLSYLPSKSLAQSCHNTSQDLISAYVQYKYSTHENHYLFLDKTMVTGTTLGVKAQLGLELCLT